MAGIIHNNIMEILMELIFETFKDPMTLSNIKISKCTLCIGIDIRRTLLLFSKCINKADFRNFSHYMYICFIISSLDYSGTCQIYDSPTASYNDVTSSGKSHHHGTMNALDKRHQFKHCWM